MEHMSGIHRSVECIKGARNRGAGAVGALFDLKYRNNLWSASRSLLARFGQPLPVDISAADASVNTSGHYGVPRLCGHRHSSV